MDSLKTQSQLSVRVPFDTVFLIRIALLLLFVVIWEVIAATGFFYRDVIPSLARVVRALGSFLISPAFYHNLGITGYEVAVAVVLGGGIGGLVGLMLGSSQYLSRAFEPYIYYVSPTPKIVLFPIVITWFGVDLGSKIGLGTIACFFPVALNIASGVREVPPILLRVGKAYRATLSQTLWKIYLPAIRGAVINAFRLGLAVTIISVLLAETKLSKGGIGYLVTLSYRQFNMPEMYALLVMIFTISISINSAFARLTSTRGPSAIP